MTVSERVCVRVPAGSVCVLEQPSPRIPAAGTKSRWSEANDMHNPSRHHSHDPACSDDSYTHPALDTATERKKKQEIIFNHRWSRPKPIMVLSELKIKMLKFIFSHQICLII